jgi:hypothetical protein
MKTREELEQAVEEASDAYYAADDARDDAKIAYGIATNDLAVYDKENWVGLTDDEIFAIGKELGLKCSLGGNLNIDIDYAKAIGAKLKEKNT